jgi:hypothetical protein
VLDVGGTRAALAAAAPLAPGWESRAGEVRRALAAAGLDFLVTGRVTGTRRVTVLVRAARTGRIVAASRVERRGDFLLVAVRMARRLQGLAFAAVGMARASAPPDLPPAPSPEPEIEDVSPPEDEPLPAPGPGPAPLAEPAAVARAPAVTAPLLMVGAGAAFAYFRRSSGPSLAGSVASVEVGLFPGARRADWIAGLGIELSVEAGWFNPLPSPGGNLSYLRLRPSLAYRFVLGDHTVTARVGYERLDLAARTHWEGVFEVVVGTPPDHFLALGGDADLLLLAGLRLGVSAHGWPAGGAGHDFGVGGGLRLYWAWPAVAVGVRYRLDFLHKSTSLTGFDFNDTVHAVGFFAGYRY